MSKSGKSSRSGLPAGQFSSVCGADLMKKTQYTHFKLIKPQTCLSCFTTIPDAPEPTWEKSIWIVWDALKISAASRKVPEILTAFTCSRTTIPTSGCAAAWTIRRLSSLPGEPDAGFAPVQTFCRKSTSHFMKPVCLKAITQKGVESCRRCFH